VRWLRHLGASLLTNHGLASTTEILFTILKPKNESLLYDAR
jgi:hypothetical protein